MKTKICKRCKIERVITHFYKAKLGKFGVKSVCKECLQEPARKRRELIPKDSKVCVKCLKRKALINFYKSKSKGMFGRRSVCKECYAKYERINYLKNKEQHKKKNKEWKDKNRAHIKLKAKEYRIKNRKRIHRYNIKYIKNKLKTDTAYKIKANLRSRLRKALKNNQKYGHTLELLGCSIEFLKKYLESQFKTGMTWDNYGTGWYGKGMQEWNIDHIRPCCTFDLTKELEQYKCFHYTNLQPLWAKENRDKQNSY